MLAGCSTDVALLFRDRVAAAEEGLPPVIMFAFDDYFPAVAATDLLVSENG